MIEQLLRELGERLGSVCSVTRFAPSSALTTYRVGGPISLLAEVSSLDQLLGVSSELSTTDVEVLVIGRGSNLLISDAGYDGVVIKLGVGFDDVVCDRDAQTVSAGGSVALPVLARRSATAGLRGLEFFAGIPGSVGGAVRMNAGGHGAETRDVLLSATLLQLGSQHVTEFHRDRLGFGYRHSALSGREIVIGAVFAAVAGSAEAASQEIDEIVRWRRQHQPGGQNCGSVFTNPDGDSAGRLIDTCGLKGTRIGGATVSAKHANFIQAEDGATADDIFRLIQLVRNTVAESTGLELPVELQLVGFEHPTSNDSGVRA